MTRTELATAASRHAEADASVQPKPTNFAGDSEHPVLQIPFTVIIDGRSYKGAGLSLVSAFAKGLATPALEGQRRIAMLRFNFGGYTVNFPVDVDIETTSSATGLVALRFLDPTGPHLPQLRYLLNAFVAGEVADVGGLLSAASRIGLDTKRDPRKAPRGSWIKRTVSSLALVAASILLAGIVSKGIYDRFFVLKADGVSVVSAEGMTLRAISSGQIDFVNPNAKLGEPLLAIRAATGDVVTLTKPCDCTILNSKVAPGLTVLAGEPLMQLSTAEAKPIVQAILNADAVQALASGAEVQIEFADGRIVPAAVSPVTPLESGQALHGQVTLSPAGNVALADLGQPVVVRILRSPSKSLSTALQNSWRAIAGFATAPSRLPAAVAGKS